MTSQELTKTTYDNFSTKNWSTTKIQVKHNIIQCNQSKQHQFIVANDNADSNYIPEFKIYIYSKTIIILTTCHKYKEQSKIKQYIIRLQKHDTGWEGLAPQRQWMVSLDVYIYILIYQ